MRGREYERASMGVQLSQCFPFLIAGHHDTVPGCGLPHSLSIVAIVSRAYDHQSPTRHSSLTEGFDQVILPLLSDDTCDLEKVTAALQSESADMLGASASWNSNDAVQYQSRIPTVLLSNHVLNHCGYGDALVGKGHSKSFAKTEHESTERTPFVAIVVRAVMGDYYLEPHEPCQRRHQGRADGMYVQNIRSDHAGVQDSQERVNQGLKAGATW